MAAAAGFAVASLGAVTAPVLEGLIDLWPGFAVLRDGQQVLRGPDLVVHRVDGVSEVREDRVAAPPVVAAWIVAGVVVFRLIPALSITLIIPLLGSINSRIDSRTHPHPHRRRAP